MKKEITKTEIIKLEKRANALERKISFLASIILKIVGKSLSQKENKEILRGMD